MRFTCRTWMMLTVADIAAANGLTLRVDVVRDIAVEAGGYIPLTPALATQQLRKLE